MALRFGENGSKDSAVMSRPFGVALLIAGFDESGANLYFADPSGTFMQYSAKAIGSASEVAQSQLQEEYKKDITLEDAKCLAAKILKQVMEDKMDFTNVQFAVVTKMNGYHLLNENELVDLLSSV